jgi:glycosyltransferase involved in cell wall biosynthesis
VVRAEISSEGFIAVARLVHQKGLDVLIDALAIAGGVARGWTLTLVGEGPEREALMAQVTRLQLGDRVRFLGHRSDVTTLLAQSAVFVLPSRFEGMPNALLEAMAQGLAVVVTDASPGPLEEIDHGRNGWVVPSEDVGALAQRLEQLAADPYQRQRFGAAARERLLSRDWSQLAPIWDGVLRGT